MTSNNAPWREGAYDAETLAPAYSSSAHPMDASATYAKGTTASSYPPHPATHMHAQHSNTPSTSSSAWPAVASGQRGGPAAAPVRPRLGGRKDSEGWAKLLRGAGYTVTASDEPDDETDEEESNPLTSMQRRLRKLGTGTFTWIILILALLWIPGIVALLGYNARPRNSFKHPAIWKIGIFWWSVWLSAGVWLSWWAARTVASFAPRILTMLFGSFPSLKTPLAYFAAVRRYVAIFLWSLCVWITWLSVMVTNFDDPRQQQVADTASLDPLLGGSNSTSIASGSTLSTTAGGTDSTANTIVTIGRGLFGLVLCAAILLGEKLSIQSIAYSFHRVSYESRIIESKLHVKVLSALFANARKDLRGDVALAAESKAPEGTEGAKRHRLKNPLRRARGNVRRVTKQSVSVLGTVARDMAASSSSAAPFSPRAIVLSALTSSSETRRLARRIFQSYSHFDVATGQRIMSVRDIAPCFPDMRTACAAMDAMDKDGNRTINEEECEAACLDVRRERNALMSSMHDIDSAVAKLDNIFMSAYLLISAIVVAALLSVKFSTLITSFGTVILGLSWLIGSTAQEALGAILFVFVKHPLDVGDHVEVPSLLQTASGTDYTFIVHEIQLMSTVFKTTHGKFVQVSNSILSQRVIVNLRRSGPIEEEIKIDVHYTTTLQQIEELRTRMLAWIGTQGRDFLSGLDIELLTLADQSKLTLRTGIRFKSNWQDSNLRTRRRNRWMCTFKSVLHECKIWGPSGNPDAAPSIQRVAMIELPPPASTEPDSSTPEEPQTAAAEYQLLDDAGTRQNNVYGEHEGHLEDDLSRAQTPSGSAGPASAFYATGSASRDPYAHRPVPSQFSYPMQPGDDMELGSRR